MILSRKKNSVIPSFFLVFWLLSLNALQAQDLFDEEHTSNFAKYLYGSKQYTLAIQEYERLLFIDSANVHYQIGLVNSFNQSGQFEKTINRLQGLYAAKLCNLPENLSIAYSKALLLDEKTQGWDEINCFTELNSGDKANFLVTKEILAGNIDLAKNNLVKYPETNHRLRTILEQPQKRLSPLLAGTMSAILPGSGKVYTKHWKDGLFALFVVSGFAYQSYRGFDKKGTKSLVGWTFGLLGGGYYLGTVYGSYLDAKKYNDVQTENVKDEAAQVIHSLY